MKARIQKLLFFAALGYIALLAGLYLTQDKLIYFPHKVAPVLAQANLPRTEEIKVTTADGLDLLAWYAPPLDNKPVVVLFHGNGGYIGWRQGKVRPLIEAGYGILQLEYRGYGGNPGVPGEAGLYEDARASIRTLEQKGFTPADIVLYGESLGTGVATQMAVEYPDIRSVILEAPYTSLPDVAAGQYRFIPVQLLMTSRYDSLSRAERIKAPVLILHGDADGIIPVQHAKTLFERLKSEKEIRIYPGGGHIDLYRHGAGADILDFLGRKSP